MDYIWNRCGIKINDYSSLTEFVWKDVFKNPNILDPYNNKYIYIS